jgi:hypothetical protein
VTQSVRPPDLLRRFIPTPYIFNLFHNDANVCIQSNDLQLALVLRRYMCALRPERARILQWKIIRDTDASVDFADILIVGDRLLRTIYAGTGTVLVYDRERSEIFGFLAPNLSMNQLVTFLIPALLEI